MEADGRKGERPGEGQSRSDHLSPAEYCLDSPAGTRSPAPAAAGRAGGGLTGWTGQWRATCTASDTETASAAAPAASRRPRRAIGDPTIDDELDQSIDHSISEISWRLSGTTTKASSGGRATPLAKPRPSSTTEASPVRGSYLSRRPVKRYSKKSRNQLSKLNLVLASLKYTVPSEASIAASANLKTTNGEEQ
uniref:Proteasome endopeptidase complex n=1 Tax=Oryza nivara TaxID=4536 RepID=A0A0E0I3K9_ORYNI